MRTHSTHRHNAWKRWLIFIAVAAALCMLLWTGWTLLRDRHIINGDGTLQSDTAVTIGIPGGPSSVDIRTEENAELEQVLLGNVYETLVSRDQDNALTPGLASEWKASKDGLTYTFTLRQHLKFANGHTLDSSDVVWSLQQIIQQNYVGADQLDGIAEVSNPDATTVTITLSEPDPTLPRRLAGRAGIVYDEEADTDYARQSAGSGPFTIAEFRPGVSITLRGNNAYWGSKPASSQITVRYFADETAMVDALRDGQIDMALPLDADTAQTLTEDPTLTVTTGESLNKTTLVFNNDADSIMSDSQMRQAVRYLVDTTAITQSTAEASQELGGPIGPLDPGYENLTDLFPYDLNKGASLASYFGTSYYGGGLRFVVGQRYAALASTIASQIQQGGVPVNVEALDDAEYQVRIDSRQFDLTLQTEEGEFSAARYADPQSLSRYTDSQAQEQYQAAMSATDEQSYLDGLHQFARTVSEDSASDWLYSCHTFVAAKPRLVGYVTNMADRRLPLTEIALS